MRRFRCACGSAAELFFGNDRCVACGRDVGFDPHAMTMVTLDPSSGSGPWPCRNGVEHGVCNWVVGAADPSPYCVSCRLNETIPQLTKQGNRERWSALEYAKRRLLYSLLSLDLYFGPDAGGAGLRFSFLEDQRTNPLMLESTVMTGHSQGLVTVNVAEADPAYREREREALNQSYRTLLGHVRHESGHFFFERLVANGPHLPAFRALFGDERADYAQALDRFHREGAVAGWESHHVSAYASSHPWEDWAECWAHYLHMTDTLETAIEYGMVEPPAPGNEGTVARWRSLTIALNELNRSMGMPDAYPFLVGAVLEQKLDLIENVISPASRAR